MKRVTWPCTLVEERERFGVLTHFQPCVWRNPSRMPSTDGGVRRTTPVVGLASTTARRDLPVGEEKVVQRAQCPFW